MGGWGGAAGQVVWLVAGFGGWSFWMDRLID